MDISVTGRHLTVSDRFREHIEDKLGKITQLEPRTRRVEVTVSHEPNRRQAKACDRVEVTCYAKGPVVRAEACADDKYAALDVVIDRLMERLRRRHDRRQVHRGRRTPESVAHATARIEVPDDELRDDAPGDTPFGDSPIEVREKVHRSAPMSLADALAEMEAVGHDFYLFHDVDTDRASVVYRRHGWSYGVLHLDLDGSLPDAPSDGGAVEAAAS
ncbi:ribosome-associated translation inhibitor RaiA [Phycicoccus sp. CSK15P-2]|uniref:ribosome hibernation-promoting factor, HPF/YfiA family n=1 Tax=Phycicoccus sp. CSK15P-2 TaxID=2807627 RepID=UPI00194E475F|nr:ribosome-associated translation inhibitor RaiA [Phycicoccus sp. CSK15P-2]MBM6404399.1 ribosome-associated translation inhibitor RaiA [Phycicoccus sp. CSK15P-2]